MYGYAGGDPINSSDPFGLCPEGAPSTAVQVGTSCLDGAAAIGMVVTGAAGAIGRGVAMLREVAAARQATSTFYRGVSAAEAADIGAHGGRLRAGAVASGNEGKYLTNTAQAARAWGAAHGPGSAVVRVDVPADAVRMFTPLNGGRTTDGIGQAWHAPMSALRGARATPVEQIIPLTPVP